MHGIATQPKYYSKSSPRRMLKISRECSHASKHKATHVEFILSRGAHSQRARTWQLASENARYQFWKNFFWSLKAAYFSASASLPWLMTLCGLFCDVYETSFICNKVCSFDLLPPKLLGQVGFSKKVGFSESKICIQNIISKYRPKSFDALIGLSWTRMHLSLKEKSSVW